MSPFINVPGNIGPSRPEIPLRAISGMPGVPILGRPFSICLSCVPSTVQFSLHWFSIARPPHDFIFICSLDPARYDLCVPLFLEEIPTAAGVRLTVNAPAIFLRSSPANWRILGLPIKNALKQAESVKRDPTSGRLNGLAYLSDGMVGSGWCLRLTYLV